MKKTIFLDRDGVINVDTGYVYKREDFQFMDYVLDDLKALCDMGYQIVIITNQSGIARGYFGIKEYKKLTKYYLREMKNAGIKKVRVLFCPHHPNGIVKKYKKECNCRKPNTGLFKKAIKRYKVDTNKSFVVGDRVRDLEISKEFPNIKPFLIHSSSEEYNTIERLIDVINERGQKFDKEDI